MLKSFLLLLSITTVVSCAHVKVPDTQACVVKGVMKAGAFCDWTLSSKPEDLTLDEWIAFLEPDPETGKGAAVCEPSEHWNKKKTALEQACALLGDRCSYEIRRTLDRYDGKLRVMLMKSLELKALDK